MLSAADFIVSTYSSPDEFADFVCEKKGYTDFVQLPDEALRHQELKLGITYVFKHGTKSAGFVTLAMSALKRKKLPEKSRKEKPHPDVPSLLLGQMARDSAYRGKGVGKVMMTFVLDTAARLSKQIGCRFVILNAEPDKVDHYEKWYGFKQIPKSPEQELTLMYFDLNEQ
jgi:GNAT superfamily N-acetyltransferase